ncbi:phosphatase [Streptomyces agglomeratus]|uniref:protein-serine/threonine phosphatase n=1 Tax=Streptomyces agglomeratus TaxID=285458 RepID=A0A1E5P8V9_9ACTN|nr:SpoIIE family protein phosphatase [Streptomyces agglomeratus]OEJ25948.1 phosphatase [Streptomyces agglomeratus]OEJ39997.1 phosphatase [Streptomyces agglomeratus]OEJ45621.1 phosphatase [Streptomyces agglomeratus]OEJ52546.1 phosphatase [Streptomyces agglomeratus]OEJ59916.1 phosphatase [Streptomyces agglomeratus]
MRTEDILAAIATGLWRWDNASGVVTLDAEAARLLGLPAEPVTLPEAAVRSRFHPVDWNEINGVVNLAVAEGTLAEARLRIMDVDGRLLRTVRSRSKPVVEGNDYQLFGTLQEVAEPRPGDAAHTPVTGDWRRSREAFLLDAGRALAEARSTAEVLRVAASLSMPGFSPDSLAVFGSSGSRITVLGHHGYGPDDDLPFADMLRDTDHPASEVVRTGRAIYLSSPEEYSRRYPAGRPLARNDEPRSWAFVPLTVAGRTMGAWMAGFAHPVAFTPDERSVLTTVARMLAQALERASVAENERELSLGLQRSMMPTLGPEIPGMTVAARYVPTGGGLQVGGDWYDMIPLPSGRIALVIGDVQGHDVRAAGLMGQLRIALRAYASEGHRPDAVLSRASRFLHGLHDFPGTDTHDPADHSGPRFATCLYIEADPATGLLDIARAGHPDPAVRLSDGTVLVRPTAGGLPLGIVADTDYPTTRLVLEPGETIMICTDGLIETGGHDLDTGWARLRTIMEEHTGDSLEKLADALVSGVHGPSSHHTTGPLVDRREDDIAVLLLCREGNGCGCGPGTAVPLAPVRRTALTVAQTEPERIAAARQQLRDLLHDWADGEQLDAAVLMVSEMVTNVLVHTDGDALLIAEAAGEPGVRRLRVEVTDASDELPHKRRPGEMASSGRGLILMEMLAHTWGVDPKGEGKAIWFELYEDRAPQL